MYDFGDTFYKRLETAINFKNISKVQFYADCHLLKASVMKWKTGSIPGGDTLTEICKYLDIDPNWLITGENNQDTAELKSPAQIYNRIIRQLEVLTKHKIHEDHPSFYLPLDNCIEPELLTKWFYGIQIPKTEQLVEVASHLGMSLSFLLTGHEEETKPHVYKDDDIDSLLRTYKCLSKENKECIRKTSYGLFMLKPMMKTLNVRKLKN